MELRWPMTVLAHREAARVLLAAQHAAEESLRDYAARSQARTATPRESEGRWDNFRDGGRDA